MPIDSTNYGHELRNIFAEIKSLRAEVADMQSAFLSVQEQYGYAVVELFNRSDEFAKEISEIKSQLQNSTEDSQKNFEEIKIQSKKISDLMNENFNSVQEKFSQIEKLLAENLDKINSRYTFSSQQNEITNKNLAAQENLLRLIAANQLLNEVQQNLPQKKSLPNVSSGRKKTIFIYGPYSSFRENLSELLKRVFQNTELTVTREVDKCRDADLIIYPVVVPLYTYEANEFFKLLQNGKKILAIIDQTEDYPAEFKAEKKYLEFKSELAKYFYTYPSDWKNVSVIYIHLEIAKRAWNESNFNLFKKSNFDEIEKFINAL